jgi:hypothetical protein
MRLKAAQRHRRRNNLPIQPLPQPVRTC